MCKKEKRQKITGGGYIISGQELQMDTCVRI